MSLPSRARACRWAGYLPVTPAQPEQHRRGPPPAAHGRTADEAALPTRPQCRPSTPAAGSRAHRHRSPAVYWRTRPTWRKLIESFASGGRELPPGDRPKDWIDSVEGVSPRVCPEDRPGNDAQPPQASAGSVSDVAGEANLADERYLIQFTASQEYTDLLERAQDLLSHAVPNRSLEQVHLRALRLLVEHLEKRKYGAPRKKPPSESSANSKSEVPTVPPDEPPPQTPQSKKRTQLPRQRGESPPPAAQSNKRTQRPRQRGPASVRREVRDRDGLQCSFVDEFGNRCRETRFLEPHHELAHALGRRDREESDDALRRP